MSAKRQNILRAQTADSGKLVLTSEKEFSRAPSAQGFHRSGMLSASGHRIGRGGLFASQSDPMLTTSSMHSLGKKSTSSSKILPKIDRSRDALTFEDLFKIARTRASKRMAVSRMGQDSTTCSFGALASQFLRSGQQEKSDESTGFASESHNDGSADDDFFQLARVVMTATKGRRDGDNSRRASGGSQKLLSVREPESEQLSEQHTERTGSAIGRPKYIHVKTSQLESEGELAEILAPPDMMAMLCRFTDPEHGFPPFELGRMKDAFGRFKNPGSAEIDVENLEKLLASLGYLKIDPEMIEKIAGEVSLFSTMDQEEYMSFMTRYAAYEFAQVRNSFDTFDMDGSGALNTAEMEEVLNYLGITPSQSMIESVIKFVDADGSGFVEFNEFVHFLALYQKSEGFLRHELINLYRVFDRFADPPKHEGAYKKLKLENISEALMHMFGPQAIGLATKLGNKVMRKTKEAYEKKRLQDMAKGKPPPKPEEEADRRALRFRDFLVWARRMREAEVSSYKKEFHRCDLDGGGHVDATEVRVILERLGYTPLKYCIDDLMEQFDLDNDNMLNFDEFVTMMEVYRKQDGFTRAESAEIQEAFGHFLKGSEEISVLQVADVLRYLGYKAELDDAEGFCKAVDFNNNGTLDFREFLRLMRLHREEQLLRLKEVMSRFSDPDTNEISVLDVKDAIAAFGHKISNKKVQVIIAGFETEHGKPIKHLGLDGFVFIADHCRKIDRARMRKQAGFSEAEIETFRAAFNKYAGESEPGTGHIGRKGMFDLLVDLDVSLKTAEDRKNLVSLIQDARLSALRSGCTEEEVGPKGSMSLRFWLFVHLLRVYQNQQDLRQVAASADGTNNLNKKDLGDFEEVFKHWLLYAQQMSEEKEDDASVASASSSPIVPTDAMPLTVLWKLLDQLGINLTHTHKEQVKGKLVFDTSNSGGDPNSAYYLNFNGFVRLISWMMDSNFGHMRTRCNEIAEEIRQSQM